MYSIGEFSRITGLTVKTLRHYHKVGLLAPACIDEETGYRYYNASSADRARIVSQLRRMQFSIGDIREILASGEDDSDLVDHLERQKAALSDKIRHHRNIVRSLETIIRIEREAEMTTKQTTFEIEEKNIEPMLIAGIRMKGCYGECGNGFSKICRAAGRHMSGKPMCLCYDAEYKENDADFEPAVPISKVIQSEGISVRELPGGRCVSLVFQGPYGESAHGEAYRRLLEYIKQHEYRVREPSREIYLKGPGMIFCGNPKKYLTEIQFLYDTDATSLS